MSISLIIIALVLGTCGCSVNTKETNLAICGSFAVPGMFCANLKRSTNGCEIIEEDSYGRILYSYTAYSVITDKKETAVLICQKLSSTDVYFYKDICYLLDEWSDEELLLLKEDNDWEKPLNPDKMSSASTRTTLDGYISSSLGKLEFSKVQTACYEALDIKETSVRDFCIIDTSEDAEIYWLVLSGNTDEECYFIRVEQDYSVTYLAAERKLDALDVMAVLKSSTKTGT